MFSFDRVGVRATLYVHDFSQTLEFLETVKMRKTYKIKPEISWLNPRSTILIKENHRGNKKLRSGENLDMPLYTEIK